MKLMTKELEKKFPRLRTTEGTDAMVIAKYFHSSWTWYAIEYCPEDRLSHCALQIPDHGFVSTHYF